MNSTNLEVLGGDQVRDERRRALGSAAFPKPDFVAPGAMFMRRDTPIRGKGQDLQQPPPRPEPVVDGDVGIRSNSWIVAVQACSAQTDRKHLSES